MSYFNSFTPVILYNEQVMKDFPHDAFKDKEQQTTKYTMWLSKEEKLLPLFSIGVNIKDITKLDVLCKIDSELNNSDESNPTLLTHYLCIDKTIQKESNEFPYFIIAKRKINREISFDVVYRNEDEDVNVQEYKIQVILTMLQLFEKEWGKTDGKIE